MKKWRDAPFATCDFSDNGEQSIEVSGSTPLKKSANTYALLCWSIATVRVGTDCSRCQQAKSYITKADRCSGEYVHTHKRRD